MSRPIDTDAPRSASRHAIGVHRYGEDATVEDRARAAVAAELDIGPLEDDRSNLIKGIFVCLGIEAVIAAVILGLVWLCR